MRRDPRAMIASLLKTPWRRGEEDMWRTAVGRRTRLHAVARDARRWAWVNGDLLPALEADARVVAVRYEDLVADPERQLRAVCRHLDEAFEPAMLDRRGGAGVDPAATGMKADWAPYLRQHQASADAPVERASLQKWRRELTPAEVAVIESMTGDVMVRHGYTDMATSPAGRRRARAMAAAAGAANAAELGLRRGLRAVLGPARDDATRGG